MSNSLEVFESTLQKTHLWLKEIMEDLKTHDRHRAYLVLRATLHALRDRLGVEEAAKLGAQLPMLVRGFYYEGWVPAKTPVKEHTADQFLVHVTEAFLFDVNAHSEDIAQAVFRVISQHVTAGEIDKVKHVLPAGIRELWP